MSTFSCDSQILQQINEYLKLKENKLCADCNSENPTWASVQNGVLICLKCSGVHGSLGVEYSFVKSITLDSWTEESIKEFVEKGPTSLANTSLEYHVPAEFLKPNPNSLRDIRENYIIAKYKDKRFSRLIHTDQLPPNLDLHDSTSCALDISNTTGNNMTTTTMKLNKMKLDKNIGEIEFIGIIVINLKSCCNLMNTDLAVIGDLSDPYVVFDLGKLFTACNDSFLYYCKFVM